MYEDLHYVHKVCMHTINSYIVGLWFAYLSWQEREMFHIINSENTRALLAADFIDISSSCSHTIKFYIGKPVRQKNLFSFLNMKSYEILAWRLAETLATAETLRIIGMSAKKQQGRKRQQ
jgi:hypothetical protein